ncbi:MAG: tRNA (mo5U34)-methyltransferase [Solirubrobacterales bacterium]|nr:tRNA (mo5U34)-methyltransferase [Solirubrobacterales bacterium]
MEAAASQAQNAPPEVPEAHNNWEKYQLPQEMAGKSFLDIGCWEGVNCAEAVRRGATQVVGVDLCTSDDLRENVETFGFEFVQMDIFSEKFLELDDFDVVLCGGVLYHVENVISLLFRLRRVTRQLLVLETKVRETETEEPLMIFKPSGDDRKNPSNWWVPNKPALREMLITCGFTDIEAVWENKGGGGARACMHAVPTRQKNFNRALPRQPRRMPLAGGGGGRYSGKTSSN